MPDKDNILAITDPIFSNLEIYYIPYTFAISGFTLRRTCLFPSQ